MKRSPLGTAARCLIHSLIVLTFSLIASSQDTKTTQKSDIEQFVNSVAKTIYKLAWPTATYRSVSLDGVAFVDEGANVMIVLSGISAFDNDKLWLKLSVMIRNGSIADIRVIDHNAILAPPFATSGAIAKALKETADQYAAQQRAQAPAPSATESSPPATSPAAGAEAACLTNETPSPISFDYHWGTGEWKHAALDPNQTLRMWWTLDAGETASPQLSIRYDDDFAPGYSERDYDLSRTRTVLPISCENVLNFKFAMSGEKILVYANSR